MGQCEGKPDVNQEKIQQVQAQPATNGEHPVLGAMRKCFPGALEAKEVSRRSKRFLVRGYGFDAENTLYGESTCPDEINHMDCSLGSYMQQAWGESFQMGGIGGCPYVGKEGYDVLMSHIPEDGNVVIMFGPHVGISPEGEVGKFSRVGQKKLSTACGAAIAAFNAGNAGDFSDQGDQDIQQSMLKQKLGKQAAEISKAEVPMAELAMRAYRLVEEMMTEIATHAAGCKHLVLIGGIQINMPAPFNEHFLPLKFTISSRTGKAAPTLKDLLPDFKALAADEVAIQASLQEHFPGYKSNEDVVKFSQALLQVKYGFTTRNTLYGQSIGADEANHVSGELADQMRHTWGHVFNLGGIGGIPFVGKTGFTAFSHHVPDSGNLLVVYAPNIGMAPNGELGKLLRDGQNKLTATCSSAIEAYNAALKGEKVSDGPTHDMMTHLKRAMAGKATSISEAKDPMAALAREMFEISDKQMRDIINFGYGNGWLALLGGIQINLSSPLASVFLPLKFTIAKNGTPEVDLMPELLHQFKIHEDGAGPELAKREGAFWARQRS